MKAMTKRHLRRLGKIGQSTAEYAVLLAIVATALISMQLYIKRGIQGRFHQLAVELAPGSSPSGAAQYEGPKVSNYTTIQAGIIEERSDGLIADIYQEDDTYRIGGESVAIVVDD